jgi:hypothetical protein
MTPNHPTYGARDLPKNPMTAPNDEHYFGCFNALTKSAEARKAHREARAATLDGEPITEREAQAHRDLAASKTSFRKAA